MIKEYWAVEELALQTRHGEGAYWDTGTNQLFLVDIEASALFIYDPVKKEVSKLNSSKNISTVVSCESGKLLISSKAGLTFINPVNGQLNFVGNPEKHIPNNRFNDGKCDPAGRFWFGSMDMNVAMNAGSLYMLDFNGRIERKLQGVTISNGIVWTADSKTMFYIDSITSAVQAFDFDLSTGEISNPRIVIKFSPEDGVPDGMAIDTVGKLWIAHWGGCCVGRWDPDTGALLAKVYVPALNVSSCCFGGIGMDILYITTSREGMNEKLLEQYPLSGNLFSARLDNTGTMQYRFNDNDFWTE